MGTGFDNLLINGFLTCLYFQLILIGVFNVLNKSTRNIVLGSICCLVSLSFIYSIFWNDYNEHLIFNLIFGGYKHIFLPALIYMYLALIKFKKSNRFILLHVLIPLLIHLAYLIIKFGFKGLYNNHIQEIVFSVNFFIFCSYLFYSYKSVRLFKAIKSIILYKTYYRYLMFFWVLMGCGIILSMSSVLPYIFGNTNYQLSFSYLSKDFYVFLSTLINLGVLLFAFLESPSLKKFIVSKNIYLHNETINDTKAIELFVKKAFIENKEFKKTDFNLAELLKEFNIKPDSFKLYLKRNQNSTPIDFINNYRIQEFKNLLKNSDIKKFSLMGLAYQVGYTSKSTFYRNFKKRESITPKEYLSKIKGVDSII